MTSSNCGPRIHAVLAGGIRGRLVGALGELCFQMCPTRRIIQKHGKRAGRCHAIKRNSPVWPLVLNSADTIRVVLPALISVKATAVPAQVTKRSLNPESPRPPKPRLYRLIVWKQLQIGWGSLSRNLEKTKAYDSRAFGRKSVL